MRKAFIWIMFVVFTACGVVEVPAGPSGETAGPVASPRLQRAAVQGGAIDPSPGCNAHTFDYFQDSAEVTLPFPINFFGATHSRLFVNNYGSVTFDEPWGSWPFEMTADSAPPIIAPFLGPIDLRISEEQSGRVQYSDGAISFGGHPAFCVNWSNVGYLVAGIDKLNSFQLLLVDRSDVGPGDFDIVMNYEQIQWDSVALEGPRIDDVLNSVPVSVGFSAGNGQENAFYSFPGSMIPGSFLDTNPETGLSRTMHNSSIPGRHIFEVRNGAGPVGDTTPPTSTAILSAEPNAGGWYAAPVTVQILATDEGSGVESIHYSLDGQETTVPGGQAQVIISSEGETVLTWYARAEASPHF